MPLAKVIRSESGSVSVRLIVFTLLMVATRFAAGQPNCVEWTLRADVSREWPEPRNAFAMAYNRLHGQSLIVGGSGYELMSDTWGWDGHEWTFFSEGRPTPRYSHVMAYDTARETAVLFGGFDTGDTWERGPSGVWTQVATTGPSARGATAMVYDSRRGVMVLFGGYDGRGFNRGDTWEWDGQTWTEITRPGPAARRYHAMAYDTRRGVTVLYGGYTNTEKSDTWEWDGETWTLVDEVGLGARTDHQMVFDEARGVSLLVGGIDEWNRTFGDLWSWDGAEWVLLAPSGPGEHSIHRMAYDSARSVTVLIGGSTSGRNVWEWDGSQWTRFFPTDLGASSGHAIVYDSARRRTVMFGGYTADGLSGKTWEWDGREWTLVAETGPSPRSGHAMVYDSRRRVTVLFGGRLPADLWEWNGQTWTEIQASGPLGRGGHAMAYDSLRGEITLFGGYSSGYLRDTWAYRDGRWRLVTTRGPSRRTGARMVYDAARDNFVLYGGHYDDSENYYTYDETWILDANGWHRLANSPPGDLGDQAMTYDSDRGVVLLHGGSYSMRHDTLRNKLWQWDGRIWTLLSSSGPTPRKNHSIAYDSHEKHLILFGGFDNQPGQRGDTWTWGHIVNPSLTLDTSCPQSGPARLVWSCATPGGTVGLAYSPRLGSFRIPDGQPCAGTWINLHPQGLQLLGLAHSNEQGGGTINGSFSANACGGYIQLLDAQMCKTSEVVRIE